MDFCKHKECNYQKEVMAFRATMELFRVREPEAYKRFETMLEYASQRPTDFNCGMSHILHEVQASK